MCHNPRKLFCSFVIDVVFVVLVIVVDTVDIAVSVVVVGPRNIVDLKFSQDWASNKWDIFIFVIVVGFVVVEDDDVVVVDVLSQKPTCKFLLKFGQ